MPVGFGANGKPHVVVTNEKSLIIVVEGNPLAFEHPAIHIAKNRQQNAGALKRISGPVNIEVGCKFGLLSVLEQIHPPGVFLAGGHVIGNNVKQQPHSIVVQSID